MLLRIGNNTVRDFNRDGIQLNGLSCKLHRVHVAPQLHKLTHRGFQLLGEFHRQPLRVSLLASEGVANAALQVVLDVGLNLALVFAFLIELRDRHGVAG